MSRSYRKTDLMIMHWILQEEHGRQKRLRQKTFAAAAKKIAAYDLPLYRRNYPPA